MTAEDLSFLPAALQAGVRPGTHGGVWHLSQAPDVVAALAAAGRLILGLDIRDYAADGTFVETSWSSYTGTDVGEARDRALEALRQPALPGEWVLITW
ncbi:hypothetical protein [Arthrobacter sp. Y-9]|uniref:hypothetical protein n=1 Tax=Arthrobacter sp. Y-9 TaxID=3039385 RepID=UPI00241EFD12|nr:hypothetical protein [Arthrobacter sp. Y-9]WFR84563.1 hypothetical protein P9849_02640 [Arthrobacter sp. Y-9]